MNIGKINTALAALAVLLLTGFTTPDQLMESKEQWISEWERGKAFTLEYIEAMPEESINSKPTPEMRSFAEQMLHLTSANIGFTAQALEVPPPFDPSGLEADESKKNKAALMEVVTQGYDFVIASLKAMDASTLDKQINLFGQFELTVDEALFKAYEHQNHHRGQTTVYIRLAGIVPPPEKLF